jgi:hypothetical protein
MSITGERSDAEDYLGPAMTVLGYGEVSITGERSDAACVGARFIAPWGGVGYPPLTLPSVTMAASRPRP